MFDKKLRTNRKIKKEKLIHIDGIDKVGKSTIDSCLVPYSNGKYMTLDRSFISQIAYTRIFKRDVNEDFFWNLFIKSYQRGDIFIVLNVDDDLLMKRFDELNEKDLQKEEIQYHKLIFNKVIQEAITLGIRIDIINTTNQTIQETLETIIDIVEKI